MGSTSHVTLLTATTVITASTDYDPYSSNAGTPDDYTYDYTRKKRDVNEQEDFLYDFCSKCRLDTANRKLKIFKNVSTTPTTSFSKTTSITRELSTAGTTTISSATAGSTSLAATTMASSSILTSPEIYDKERNVTSPRKFLYISSYAKRNIFLLKLNEDLTSAHISKFDTRSLDSNLCAATIQGMGWNLYSTLYRWVK